MNTQSQQIQYDNIYLTHLELHVVKPRNVRDWYQAIRKTRRTKANGQVFSRIMELHKDGSLTCQFALSPTSVRQFVEENKAGRRIRFLVPKKGLPVYPGKDVIEYLRAKNRKI